MHKQCYILVVFVYVSNMIAAFPSPIMDSSTVGQRPRAAGQLLWRLPLWVSKGGKYVKNNEQIHIHFRWFAHRSYSLYVTPGGICFAESTARSGNILSAGRMFRIATHSTGTIPRTIWIHITGIDIWAKYDSVITHIQRCSFSQMCSVAQILRQP